MLVPKLATTLRNYDGRQLTHDLTAGVIVGVVAIPLAIVSGWLGFAMLGKAWTLRRQRPGSEAEGRNRDAPPGGDRAS